jgi:hypothetical protein
MREGTAARPPASLIVRLLVAESRGDRCADAEITEIEHMFSRKTWIGHTLASVLPIPMVATIAAADALIVTKAMNASTIAEIFVEPSTVRIELEIGVRNLEAFRNLMPDPIYEKLGHQPRPFDERLEEFLHAGLVLRTERGQQLAGVLVDLDGRRRVPRDDISGEPLPADDDSGDPVVFAVLQYEFPDERPQSLSIFAPRNESGSVDADIGFVTYHLGLPVNDFRYLSYEQVLALDWDDPWHSRFRNRNLRRQYDTAMNAFLYVEPYEVRTEIIVRPFDLQKWVDLGLAGQRTIPVGMQEDVRQKAAAFLAERTGVTIDGEAVPMTLDRAHFLRRTLRTSTVIDPPEELDAFGATLGVIFVRPTLGLPQEATLSWDLFGPKLQKVRAAATDEAGPLPYMLTPDDNVLRWQNFLKNPTIPTLVAVDAAPPRYALGFSMARWPLGSLLLLALVYAGATKVRGRRLTARLSAAAVVLVAVTVLSFAIGRSADVDDERAGKIMSGLLHNVYRAFDFRDESTIYDTLEHSVSGDLLTQIYLETKRGLELASQGGARAKVKEIELLEVEAQRATGERAFTARSTWNIRGAVGHWGHIHERTNQYQADFRIEPVDGVWKITELELLQEERI